MAEHARTELVAKAFAESMTGIASSGMVATQLPTDNTTWSASGFVVVGPVVGGVPQMYVPLRQPIVQHTCYGVNPGTKHPDWGKAENLANLLVEGCYDGALVHKPLTLRAGIPQALVAGAVPMSEPTRIEGDPSGYAIYTVDIEITWKEVEA